MRARKPFRRSTRAYFPNSIRTPTLTLLDSALLEKTAKRVGPLPGELFNGWPADRKLVKHFEFRAGINKPVNFNLEQMSQAFEEDRAGATTALAISGKGV